jgi:hypothetical protein
MKEESYTEPQLASRPEEEKMAKKYAADTLKQAVKDQAPPPERESIELALVMKKEIPPESLAPGAAMEAAPAPKKKMRRSLALPQTVPSGKPDRDEEQDDSLSRLRKLIELVGGEVVSVEYNEQTNTPASIGAWIPADQVYTFYNKLKELGDLRTPPEAVTGKGHEVLSVSIRLLSSEILSICICKLPHKGPFLCPLSCTVLLHLRVMSQGHCEGLPPKREDRSNLIRQ